MFQEPASGMSASPLITGNPSLPGRTRTFNVHAIEFTGSGSEYFRIWIVNLLLTLVTLGLYYPWAKVRKLRYFHGNTVVAGHPLDFHGDPRRMLRGFLLVTALMGLYTFAGRVSPLAGGISAVILAALWPALIRASLQFRLGNTSWRGLRLGFTGSLKDAYMVVLVPALVFAGLGLLSAVLYGLLGGLLPEGFGAVRGVLAFLPLMLGVFSTGPYIWWRIKRYQHSNYALGPLQTTFRASFGSMLGVFFKTSLVGLACMAAAFLAIATMMPAGAMEGLSGEEGKARVKAVMTLIFPAFVILFLLAQLVQGPYFASRMQNLVWTETGNTQLRFRSNLGLGPLMWVTFKNWVFTLLTLGFYWPFAAVALARVRLGAIVIHSRQDPDQLVALGRRGSQDAAGDLAADMIGIDFGF